MADAELRSLRPGIDPLRSLGGRRYRATMLDDTPWFRRWFGFSYLPITWQGWATSIAFLMVELPLMLLSWRAEGGSFAWWLSAIVSFAIFLGFWAFTEWKTEES